MRSAEIERTTAEHRRCCAPAATSRCAPSARSSPSRLLALYGVEAKEDREPNAEDDEDSRELPPLDDGDRLKLEEALIEQHFTQPPPRYSRSQPDQEDGRDRHRPARPPTPPPCRCCRTATTCGSKSARCSPRIAAASSPPSSRASSIAMSSTASPPASRSSSICICDRQAFAWKDVLARLLERFPEHVEEIKDLRVSEVLDALNEMLSDHIFPGQGRRLRSAPLPELRRGPAVAQAGQVRRLHRLLELPRVPLHHAAFRRRHWRRQRSRCRRRHPGHRPRVAARGRLEVRPFRPICAAGRRSRTQALVPAQGLDARDADARQGAAALRCPAKSAFTRKRASRSAPASGATDRSSCTTAPMPTSPDVEEVFTVGINRAVDLHCPEGAGGGRFGQGRAGTPAAIQTFEHDAGPITVRAGRYGPYVNQGKVNATLPKGVEARGRNPRAGTRAHRRQRAARAQEILVARTAAR